MNLIINRDSLLDSLNIVQKGLSSKTTMPVLTGIKLEAENDMVILTTSNTDISIMCTINDSNLQIKEEGKIIIPGKYFLDIIRKIEAKNVELSLIENKTLLIKANRSEFKLNLLNYDEYPQINFINNLNFFELNSKIIKSIIKETNYSTSDSEKRPILTGVNFKLSNNELSCISTDSYRLSKKIIKLKDVEDFNIVIPNKSLTELEKIIDNYNDSIKIYISNNKILFSFKNINFQTRLLEGNYPDTSRLIPTEFPVIIKFNKDELLNAVDRVSLLSPKDRENNYNIIKLNLKKNQIIEITSTDTEIGDALEEIVPIDTVIGSQIQIAFSSKYLVEALKSFISNEISLNFTGEVKPFIIKGNLDENLIHMILPVKID